LARLRDRYPQLRRLLLDFLQGRGVRRLGRGRVEVLREHRGTCDQKNGGGEEVWHGRSLSAGRGWSNSTRSRPDGQSPRSPPSLQCPADDRPHTETRMKIRSLFTAL